MSSSTPDLSAAVLTVSDSCAQGKRTDQSGPAVSDFLHEKNFKVLAAEIVADDQAAIERALTRLAEKATVVITTGGTGIAARDVTPEATRAVCERMIEGIPERMRSEGGRRTSLAALSRAACGVRGRSLILNLPGSPKGAVESLQAVIDLLPHALQLLRDETEHKPVKSGA